MRNKNKNKGLYWKQDIIFQTKDNTKKLCRQYGKTFRVYNSIARYLGLKDRIEIRKMAIKISKIKGQDKLK